MLPELSTRAFRKRCFSPFHLTAAFHTAMSPSMKDSKQMGNNRMQGARLYRAPDAGMLPNGMRIIIMWRTVPQFPQR
jgi:hypothetical protein